MIVRDLSYQPTLKKEQVLNSTQILGKKVGNM